MFFKGWDKFPRCLISIAEHPKNVASSEISSHKGLDITSLMIEGSQKAPKISSTPVCRLLARSTLATIWPLCMKGIT